MKWLAIIFFLVAAFDVHALIANNLAADWQGGAGLTVSGGKISQWNDQHQLLNNDGLGPHTLTQSNAAFQPYDWTDSQGYRGVMFPWAFSSANPNTCLNISNSLSGLNTTNLTVYIVATGPVEQENNQTLIWFNGYGSGWIKFYHGSANYPLSLFVGSRASTLYPPINRSVIVGAGDAGKTTLRWNNAIQTNAPLSATTTGGGGMVSSYNGGEFYSGVIYRILVYNVAHTPAQMDAQVAELAALYGVLTNYTKQVVCRGDSITAGVGSGMLQSYPFQLSQRYPELEWHNQGIGSIFIGTNGDSGGTMFDTDTNFVDTLYDGNLQQNWLFFLGGLNDIGGLYPNGTNLAAAVTFGRLTNYLAARKAVRPWTVVVSTVQGIANNDARNAANIAYNSCIRTLPGNWDYLVDPGINSPIESRLNNPYNLNIYWVDGLHLTNAGYEVLVEHFQQKINVPHRTTGFLGP
jgi:lysophospholipase L1-like esterase